MPTNELNFVRGMSFVPRWSIIRNQREQTVADHTFYVVFYTDCLIKEIGLDLNTDMYLEALRYAIYHDLEEVLTGDIPGPAKRLGGMNLEFFHDLINYEVPNYWSAVRYDVRGTLGPIPLIIKVADLMDEVFYLYGEFAAGNSHVVSLIGKSMDRLKMAWENMIEEFRTEFPHVDKLWDEWLLPQIDAAVLPPFKIENNDDVAPSNPSV